MFTDVSNQIYLIRYIENLKYFKRTKVLAKVMPTCMSVIPSAFLAYVMLWCSALFCVWGIVIGNFIDENYIIHLVIFLIVSVFIQYSCFTNSILGCKLFLTPENISIFLLPINATSIGLLIGNIFGQIFYY